MAKEVFGEFSAYTTPGGVRFMKNGKLTSEAALPPEVVSYLKNKLGDSPELRGEVQPEPAPGTPVTNLPEPTFPRPSEEQLAAMRAESAAKLAGQPGEELKTLEEPAPLTEDDFDTGEPMPAPQNVTEAYTEPSAEQMHEVAHLLAPDSNGNQPLPRADVPRGLDDLPRANAPELDPNFLESVSIHTAPLEDIAHALYERFGVYTVYLRKLPENDEVNPLTGVAFTKYHLGIAYQAAIYAQNQGLLDRAPERARQLMDEGRFASQNLPIDQQAHTRGENRAANTFAHRTSVEASQGVPTTRIVHRVDADGVTRAYQETIPEEERIGGSHSPQRFDRDEDEQIVEPPIFGTQPRINPNW